MGLDRSRIETYKCDILDFLDKKKNLESELGLDEHLMFDTIVMNAPEPEFGKEEDRVDMDMVDAAVRVLKDGGTCYSLHMLNHGFPDKTLKDFAFFLEYYNIG